MHKDMQRALGGIAVFAVLATAITTSILLVGGSEPVGASELTRFASCDAMQTWVDDVRARQGASAGAVMETTQGDAPTSAAPATDSAQRSAAPNAGTDESGTGGTNTVVEGVDEIDIVDRLPGGRALVAREGTLSLVDLDRLTLLDSRPGLPPDARVSVGGDVVWVVGSAPDGRGVRVERLRPGQAALTADGSWTTPGRLLDARRTGERLHVVAVDEPYQLGAIPFEGGPVPCDQVWRPEGGADTPAATLLATLPAEGALTPTATAEVVGAGAGFLVTETAAYVTTQSWDAGVTTGVHRFDLATLAPSGSGSVPGMVPGPFGLSEHEGHLRVATNVQPQFRILTDVGRPAGPADDVVSIAPAPQPQENGPLAEVFVLDLDGALDTVGRTGRFGHDGETIQGIRFVGDTAYVVTFLQTDPFWVLDLSDPTAPKTVGELQIPGFSGYLHPVSDTRVVGFGPDGAGKVAARLFDVSDHTKPTVVDELTLGSDSPVVFDHHAYVALDRGRFAVPVNEQPTYVGNECAEPVPVPDARPTEPGIAVGEPNPDRPCQLIAQGGSTAVVVLAVRDGRLVLADRRSVETNGEFTTERVLPTSSDAWVLVGYDRLVNPDGGQLVLPR
jgi:uncharacterized secreted protein with C-terminal beta-propeller domain